MAYQALLFCPEEKTARTVTQVLSELEFSVEPCSEPFAAVKKLMGQHFDAIVVDCDNEQNATLLFKSARNSTSNQASLAVAIVEGQAGVAKAFRIGANLVLTKPINVEQSKGTLRVARGLLRKGEPVKPAAPAAGPSATSSAPAPPVAKPVAPKPPAPARFEAAATGIPTAPKLAPIAPKPESAPAPRTAVAQATAAPLSKGPEINGDAAPAPPAQSLPSKPVVSPVASAPITSAPAEPTLSPAKPKAVIAEASSTGFGAAAAPARAKEPPKPEIPSTFETPKADKAQDLHEKPAEEARSESALFAGTQAKSAEESAPSFTFAGATADEPASGGGKKILIGVAAVAIVVAGLYFGWERFQVHGSNVAVSSPVVSPVAQPAITAPAKPSSAPAVMQPPAEPKPLSETSPASIEPESSPTGVEDTTSSLSSAKNPSSSVNAKTSATAKTSSSAAPLMVKSGTAAEVHKTAPVVDASAPSMVGIATPGSNGALSNIVSNGTTAQPVLQTLNISQGVSQGLLLKKVQPVYPKTALTMHIEGAVELQATISKTGAITALKIIKGDPQLSRAAADAVKQWKYKPYMLDGEPVEIQTQITVVFKLPS